MNEDGKFGTVRDKLLVSLTSVAMVAAMVPAPALAETVADAPSTDATLAVDSSVDEAITVVDEANAVQDKAQEGATDEAPAAEQQDKDASGEAEKTAEQDAPQDPKADAEPQHLLGAIDSWSCLQQVIDEIPEGSPSVITLTEDLKADKEDALVIPAGKVIIIDLNGHAIDRNLNKKSKGKRIFENHGSLTLTGNGTLTGGSKDEKRDNSITPDRGGAILNDEGADLTLDGCTICSMGAYHNGGAIYNSGTLTIKDAVLRDNATFICNSNAYDYKIYLGGGGAIYNEGSLEVFGGSIEGNRCGACIGGGVFNKGTFVMHDGAIKDNRIEWFNVYASAHLNGKDLPSMINAAQLTPAEGGAGVYNEGTFELRGGTVSGNVCYDDGAGVFNAKNATFTMTDGAICDNQVAGKMFSRGGGIANVGHATVTGGSISNNRADSEYLDEEPLAGGIWNGGGRFDLSNCMVSDNHSKSSGGGIVVEGGDVTLDNVQVTGNSCDGDCTGTKSGGGISLTGGTLTATACEISYNTSKEASGGGVYVGGDSTLRLVDGSVTGNSCRTDGGGINFCGAKLSLAGHPVVSGNKSEESTNNLHLVRDRTIEFADALTDGADICVGVGGAARAFTCGYSEKHGETDPRSFFSSEEKCVVSKGLVDGEACLMTAPTSWSALGKVMADKNAPSYIEINQDLKADGDNGPLDVPEGREVTLDLNGHTLDRGLVDGKKDRDGSVIVNRGKLRLVNGTVTGGNAEDEGGGILNWGNLTLDGVKVTKCHAAYGGGISNNGEMKLVNTEIAENGADTYGGGIRSLGAVTYDGTVTISNNQAVNGGGFACYNHDGVSLGSGVTIAGNHASKNGGGILVGGDANLTLDGVKVEGNVADDQGGGAHVENGSLWVFGDTQVVHNEAKVGGGANFDRGRIGVGDEIQIIDNTAKEEGNNVWIPDWQSLRVARPLKRNAKIGVAKEGKTGVFTMDYNYYHGDNEDMVRCFIAEEGLWTDFRNGEVEITDIKPANYDKKDDAELAKYGYSLVLEDGFDIVCNVKELTDDPSNYTIEYTYGGETHTEQLKNKKLNSFVVASCAAKEMTSEVKVVIRHNDEVIKEGSYSVKGYCEQLIASCENLDTEDEKAAKRAEATANACKAVLDYGSCAQEEFKYDVDHLANGGKDFFDIDAIEVPATEGVFENDGCAGIIKPTFSLVTESKTQFVVNFEHEKGVAKEDYRFTVDGEEFGSDKVREIEGKNGRNGKFSVVIEGIAAKDLAQEHTIIITDQDGKTCTYTASPVSYMHKAVEVGKSPKLNKALFNYSQTVAKAIELSAKK